MKPCAWLIFLAGVMLAPLFAQAAGDVPRSDEETPALDIGETHSESNQQGLELHLNSKLDLLRNVSGGIATGGSPMAHFEVSLGADFDKIIGWTGTTGLLNLVYNGGGRINAERVGSQMGVSNIEVPTSTFRLFQAWLQKELWDGRGALLIGLYPIDSEFQVLDSAALFLQPPYGATADLAQTRGPSIFDNSAFGLRGKWLSQDHSAYVLGAVLDGIPGDPDNPRGTRIKFDKGDGTMSIAEIGYKPTDAVAAPEPVAAEAAAERIEKYAVGFWHYTAHADDLMDLEPSGVTPKKRPSWGWYGLAERSLYKTGGGADWAGFLRISGTDGNSTAVRRATNVGVRGRGIIPGRAGDVFGLAYTHVALSEKFRLSQSLAGMDATPFEDAWEVTYRIPLTQWLAVQPDLQRIRHPGGDGSRSAALIIGARIELTF